MFNALQRLWCQRMHRKPRNISAPVHGSYHCWECGQVYRTNF